MDKGIIKPANKWRRRDFQPILRHREDLQKLTLGELRALFLTPEGPFYRSDVSVQNRSGNWRYQSGCKGTRRWMIGVPWNRSQLFRRTLRLCG